ncbi:biotin--[acetyl-CoA-carboxylase] ligase [Chlamydia ibidis]|uniref:Biotin--[acetyl-CoA-carboxylase] ligase n=2 Tax=Chlamydia ibidis TaxID=1405396 RepID=S7KK43_9CHLA|nr:biotin--[acetyl-CoA-carboxylase] ligase [Chlamydia ibidis]EPP34780.1 biotin--[acetyl-CoA-carboxylase] ligase [Chlamydia ibidis]EQM62240.1 biotin--[acetyl-CoA-carboxylase] ligase [Chlamydia ibidis 10-1398/6]
MKVIYYEIAKTSSTNITAKKLIPFLPPYALTVISTKNQTAGRGKIGRSWISTHNDITISLCFFITDTGIDSSRLFRMGTTIVLSLVNELGIVGGTIKWPNDVLIKGEKLAGVLTETIPVRNFLGVILGIGINGNTSHEDLSQIDQPATSLAIALEKPVNLEQIQSRLIYYATRSIQENLGVLLPLETDHRKIKKSE